MKTETTFAIKIKQSNANEVDYHVCELKKKGYRRVSNCYWYQDWVKETETRKHTVTIEIMPNW